MFNHRDNAPRLLWVAPLLGLVFAPALAYASPPIDPGFYQVQQAYDLTGMVLRVNADELRVAREALPYAELEVSAYTRVLVDGRPATLAEVEPGMATRVKFQLHGDEPVALTIDAVSR